MAFRIEYFRQGVPVMAVPFPRSLGEAKAAALTGLDTHDADVARILDMDHKGTIVGVVRRSAVLGTVRSTP
jgi:hypothetical protein